MTAENFGPVWAKLTVKERETCAKALLLHYEGARNFDGWHAGLLPFTKYSNIRAALACNTCAGKFEAEHQRILKKCHQIRVGLRLWRK